MKDPNQRVHRHNLNNDAREPVTFAFGSSTGEAERRAYREFRFGSNQCFRAVPRSRANKADWNNILHRHIWRGKEGRYRKSRMITT